MASISVRKLNDELVQLLQVQAMSHGVSMEEEVRQILIRGVSNPELLGDFAVKIFSPGYLDTDTFEIEQRKVHKPIEFK